VESFRAALVAQGYKPLGVVGQVRLAAHVSRWLAASGLEPGELTEGRIEEFLKCRRAAGYTQWLSPLATVPLMGHLRRLGVAPAPPPAPTTAVEELVAHYRDYLVGERGLAPATVASYLHVARLFLSERSDHPGFGLNRLSAGEVTDFVLGECRGRSVGSTASVVCWLRALLRFVYVDGLTPTDLASAVPNAPSWRLTWLPRSVDATTVSRLLKSCDRRTTIGRRDYAILTLLVRLGLRRGEVAALNLADIDWRAGEIVIRGKGRREERLPLPVDVGEAVAGWLRRGRPRNESARVFLRVRAPLGAMSPVGVSHVVHSASQRAGVAPVTAHQLRHTAATQMLRAGADLTEIGQVLRHRSQLSTAIYAKVDLGGLRSVAQCWPGGAA
jgi:site-specific recombinase XerD